VNLDPSLAFTALLSMWPGFGQMDGRDGDRLIGSLAAAMTAANPKDRWEFARAWIAERQPRPGTDGMLLAWLRGLPAGDEPATYGPLCADWYDQHPADAGCEHASCYAVAYCEPLHECAVEADRDDPISREYGMYLATCDICDLWQQATERYHDEAAWERQTRRANR
jgi:hypothetical protein